MAVLLDDRLLIEELLVGLPISPRGPLQTTSSWYFRARRAAVLGGGGQLSGPFGRLSTDHQGRAIQSLLELPESIALPQARQTIPAMAALAARHPKLNLLNLEAVAVAELGSAVTWLSPRGAAGVLPAVLEAEGLTWRQVNI